MFNPEITTPEQRRKLDILLLGLLPLSFSSIILIAGCGGAPLGLLIMMIGFKILDNSNIWDTPIVFIIATISVGTGLALHFVSIFIHSKGFYLYVSAAALVMLIVSWWGFIVLIRSMAEGDDNTAILVSSIGTFIVTSIPFGMALQLRIRMLCWVYYRL